VIPAVVSIITYNKPFDEETTVALDSNQNLIKKSSDIQQNIKTGLVLTSDGLILSVLKKEEETLLEDIENVEFKILGSDGHEYDAKVRAIDEFNRLVFYKVEASNLASPELGNSDELETGEKIIVAGNASGEYQNNFSLGIISQKDRTFSLMNSELSSSEKMEGAILADVIINDQNVGGPVIDFAGTVVGVANKITKDGKELGFIVPINRVRNSIEKVIKGEKFANPFLGVYYLSINREIALLNNLPVSEGALIYSFSGQQGLAVIVNSPADEAGIKLGDIILKVDEENVTLDQPLSFLIAQKKKGDNVKLEVLRNGKKLNLEVELE
jgi:serine protease Do